jgi:transcriptional regulator with XRE-family HTH domain
MRIRERRLALRMNQKELSQMLGVTFQQVQKYERGTNRVAISMLVKMAAALATTAAQLLDEGETQVPEGVGELFAAFATMEPRTRQTLLSVARLLLDPA